MHTMYIFKFYKNKKDGASLIYTSIKNNCNLNLLYEYTLSIAYGFPFRFKSEAINE